MSTSAGAPELVAADSFRVRVRDGRAEVRGVEQHIERFRWAVSDAMLADGSGSRPEVLTVEESTRRAAATSALFDPNPVAAPASFSWLVHDSPLTAAERATLDAFLIEAGAEIERFGEGFPRLEMWRDPDGSVRFACSLRPLPPLGETLQLTSVVAAPCAHARRKGPNIASYSALNRRLSAEAVLVDATGFVREGATTSFVCWPDDSEQTGYVIDSDARVASVTEAILVAATAQRLVGEKPNRTRTGLLARASATLSELQRAEVWAVNALHGIRTVSHIDGVTLPSHNASRLQWFREALDRSWQPVEPVTRGDARP